jgi:hypothetical protein
VEPFIIATRRHLSTMHPLHMFLQPHFKDTMHINAWARGTLIKAGGIIENVFASGKYSIGLSLAMYRRWRLDDEALPKDLIKEVGTTSSIHNVMNPQPTNQH